MIRHFWIILLSVGILSAQPSIQTSELPDGIHRASYQQQLTATGGTPPYQWSLAEGQLPFGLTLSTTGVISGTAFALSPNPANLKFSVRDAAGRQASRTVPLMVYLGELRFEHGSGICPTPECTFIELMAGEEMSGFWRFKDNSYLELKDPQWIIHSGTLPPGTRFDSHYPAFTLLNGIPTTAGTYRVSITARGSNAMAKPLEVVFSIRGSISIETPDILPQAVLGKPYSHQLTAAGGIPPYTWRTWTSPPDGFFLLADSGRLQGTPQKTGTYTFTVQVFESSEFKRFSFKQLTLTIVEKSLTIETAAVLPPAITGVPYRVTMQASGGKPPYQQWVVSRGALPEGLTLTSAGILSGNPIRPTQASFSVTVRDSSGGEAVRNFTLPVAPGQPIISEGGVLNGASFEDTPLAPGSIVTIFGHSLGSPELVTFQMDSAGHMAKELSDVRVLFDDSPAPILYTMDQQVSVITPYNIAGKETVELVVEYQGKPSIPVRLSVAPSAPGIFTLDSSGKGQGAILNQDWSINSPESPAPRDSIVMVYATGEGQTDPAGVDGKLVEVPLPQPIEQVTAFIGEQLAEVLYAGGSPGQVSGLLQVNIRIPKDAPVGDSIPVRLKIGTRESQAGVTLVIQP